MYRNKNFDFGIKKHLLIVYLCRTRIYWSWMVCP